MGVAQTQTGNTSVTNSATQLGTDITTAGQYQCLVQLNNLTSSDRFAFWAEVINQSGETQQILAGSYTVTGGVPNQKALQIPQGDPCITTNEISFWGIRLSGSNQSVRWSINNVDASATLDRAGLAADTGLQSVRSNTAQAGASTSITLDASASSGTDFYLGCDIYITGGTGVGQFRTCTAYNGTTKVATVSPAWATNPAAASTFAVMPQGSSATVSGTVNANVLQWNSTNVATPATAGVPEVNVRNINNVAAATPGASGGLLIAGSNAGTTTLGALTVTGATTLAAVAMTTLATSGTATLNALTVTNALTVSGATTLTGAVGATNASNDIRGITVGVNGITTASMSTDSLSAAAVSAAAVTKIQTGLATSTALGTVQTGVTQLLADTVAILARIGGFAGSGTSTIFGWLRALGRSDLAAPTDYNTGGGTFSPTTDALQAIAAAAFDPVGDSVAIKTGGIVAASFAADAISAAALSTAAADEIATSVWAAGTRTLTAGTNIVLAKGVGVTGFNDLSQADVRSAVGLASADLDAQLAGLDTAIGAVPAAVWSETVRSLTDKAGFSLAAAGLDAIVVEIGLNARQALSIATASAAGVLAGAPGPTITINGAGVATQRIEAAVDGAGNRTSITLSPPA